MALALFGITNDALNLVVNLLVLFAVVVWFALVAWTYFDARRRLEDPTLVMTGAAASLIFPYVGTVVYSILRPPEFIEDKRERELEIRAAELRVRQLEGQSCPHCEHPVEGSFLRCPNCRARIKDPCESCAKPIDPRWSICPYCETPVRGAAPEPRRVAAEARGRSTARSKAPPTRQDRKDREELRAREKRERERKAAQSTRATRTVRPAAESSKGGGTSQRAERSKRSSGSRSSSSKKRGGGPRGRPAA